MRVDFPFAFPMAGTKRKRAVSITSKKETRNRVSHGVFFFPIKLTRTLIIKAMELCGVAQCGVVVLLLGLRTVLKK